MRVVAPSDQVSSAFCPTICGLDVGPEVERQPEIVASRRLEAVDDLEPPKSLLGQADRSAVKQAVG